MGRRGVAHHRTQNEIQRHTWCVCVCGRRRDRRWKENIQVERKGGVACPLQPCLDLRAPCLRR